MATRRPPRAPKRATSKRTLPSPASTVPVRSNPSDPTPPGGYRIARFLSPDQLVQGVEEVRAIAARARVSVLLVGGFAMQHYGSDRLTGDLDFAARAVPSALPVLGSLEFGGVQSQTPSGVPLDFIVRADDYAPLYEEAVVAATVNAELGVKIVRPEHLVAMKMAAGRGKDLLDLKFLLAQEGLVELGRAREIVRKHLGPYAAREFDRLLDEVAWEKARPRR